MKRVRFSMIVLLILFWLQPEQSVAWRIFTAEQLSSTTISAASVCQDAEGYIWVGTEYGLNRYDGYHFVSFLNHPSDPGSIANNLVSTVFCEPTGEVWIGTGKGLDLYNPSARNFLHFRFPDGLKPRVTKILRLSSGELMVGTAGYGLYKADKHTLTLTREKGFTTADDDEFYSNLFEDSTGRLWKCDASQGISVGKLLGHALAQQFVSVLGTPMGFAETDGKVLILCMHGILCYQNGQLHPMDYEMDSGTTSGLVFRTIYKDKTGDLYIGTRGSGLFCMKKGTNRMTRIETDTPEIGLNTSKVWSIFKDRQDNLWIGCQQRGLLMLPQRALPFSSWQISPASHAIGAPVTAICQGDNGLIWCSVQENGIYGFNLQGKLVQQPKAPMPIESIHRDAQGRYWVGTDKALYSYNPLTGSYKQVAEYDCDKFNVLADDGKGKIYISTFSRGFCIYDVATGRLVNYNSYQKNSKKGELCNNWIQAILPDSKGRIWLATSTGVSCFNPASGSFNALGWSQILNDTMCYSLCETNEGDILIGTGQGLFVYRNQSNRVEELAHSELLRNRIISYMVCDRSGGIWCSTSMGICYYDSRNAQWTSYVRGNGLSNREYVVGAGLHTDDNSIYFGTADGITTFKPDRVLMPNQSCGQVVLTALVTTDYHYPTHQLAYFEIPYQTNSFTMEFSLLDFIHADNTIYEYNVNNAADWTALDAGDNTISFNHLASGTYRISVRANVNGVYSPVSMFTVVVLTPWYRSAWAIVCYLFIALVILFYLIYIYIREKRRQMDDEKMKFLINATHDIRSPLTLIMAPLEKLKQRHPTAQDAEELGLIERNTQRILNLVNQILDMRKIDKQQMQLQCQHTDMVAFAEGVFNMYKYNANERHITYEFKHPDQRLMAWIDHAQFDKVISNLLSNAFKYTFDGGHITLGLSDTADGHISLTVEDDGIGIKPEDRKHIFDRFYQSHPSGEVHLAGTGIGLNLCKMIVDMHHGSIDVSTGADEHGSCFVVRLPKGHAHLHPQEMITEVAEKPASSTIRPANHYRILFVDDDAELCSFIVRELAKYYHVDTCYNGRDAMKTLLNTPYDLVVSDVMMPEMDGFTLLRMIKKNPVVNHIPVIMLTSKADVANRLEGLEGGADAFMSKPFNIHELHVVINSLISNVLRLKGKFTGAQQQKDKIEEKQVKSNDEALMERVMQAVNKHMDDSDFTAEQLATEVGLSRTHLQRKMKDITGLNVKEFVRNLRLEQAARMLREQKLNVSQVAYSVGFSNLAHFSTVFRKHFGVSPSEYVAQQK